MKTIISIEEVAMFLLAIFGFSLLPFSWWVFPALLLLPDLSMIGYLINTKIGAIVYNLFHHKALAILIYVVGYQFSNSIFQLVGVILFAHASMDRVFGYGLKYFTDFKHTHLGIIGKSN
jgi:hypothetical protein